MIKILIVDDSATMRKILRSGLSAVPDFLIVGEAVDSYDARDKIIQLQPDVITLDVEMPRLNGIELLKRLMIYYPLPVIMVSALTELGKKTTFEALEAGAFDFVTKPSTSGCTTAEMIAELVEKIKMAVRVNLKELRTAAVSSGKVRVEKQISSFLQKDKSEINVIAIGSSTGGTNALREIISQLPDNLPGIVIVQHITPGFTRLFAERLNECGKIRVKEAENGEIVSPGFAYVAASNSHTRLKSSGDSYLIECTPGDSICGHKPSVEALFSSVAQVAGKRAIGIILTGMGGDGAGGLLAMRNSGSRTLGQNESSCVVYGMPKVAWEKGGVEKQVSLEEIPAEIIKLLNC
ncbi:MAG: chemotaxis response regulator protein-glutamate methylesterase [Candidatus Riflebacteria bacterium]|nr:chemotaxis response regulator protein-glutamate methylesterase [Candidatus Riflebacteria bacterium]